MLFPPPFNAILFRVSVSSHMQTKSSKHLKIVPRHQLPIIRPIFEEHYQNVHIFLHHHPRCILPKVQRRYPLDFRKLYDQSKLNCEAKLMCMLLCVIRHIGSAAIDDQNEAPSKGRISKNRISKQEKRGQTMRRLVTRL